MMIISLTAPRFDPLASLFLKVERFDIGNERIHKTSAALGGSVELQDTGTRMQSDIAIVIRNANTKLYDDMQYMVNHHPLLHMSHKDGFLKIAPTSAKLSAGGTITLNALVVGSV